MTLSVDQQAALEKPALIIAYFAEFHFADGVVYVSSLPLNINWGGHDWIGLGAIGSITVVEESQGTAASALSFDLNIVQPEWLALSVGTVEQYRGRDAKLYFCPLNENYQLIDTPQVCWRGTMDTMTSEITGNQGESAGRIVLKCETSAYGLKRKSSLRVNDPQQQQRYPGDTGLAYLNDLLATPSQWLSKKFQRI
jgi:hypothetical protein